MRFVLRVAIFAVIASSLGFAQAPVIPTTSDPDPITMTANGCIVNYLGGSIATGTWTMEYVDNSNTPTVFRTGTNQIMIATTMTGSITSGSMINPRTNNSSFSIPNPSLTSLTNYGLHITLLDKAYNKVTSLNKVQIMLNSVPVSGRFTQFNVCLINASMNNSAAPMQIINGPKGDKGDPGTPGTPGVATYTGSTNTPGATDVTLMTGSDFGAKLNTCMAAITASTPTTGGICESRNINGVSQTMTTPVTVTQDNLTIFLPCATITTSTQFTVAAGVRNTTIHGCSNRGGSQASGAVGGSVWVYSGTSGDAFDIGDTTYAVNTSGFHMDNVSVLTTSNLSASSAMRLFRVQEYDLHNLYFNGPQSINAGNIGIYLDGTGNYTGGTMDSVQIAGYTEPMHLDGHLSGSASGDFANASTFTRMHIDCPTSGGYPIAGSIGINANAADGNTWVGGDVEGCDTMFHMGANAINNTIVGLRNENSNMQYKADAGSSLNSVTTGGAFDTGQLVDLGSRNNFNDAFHYNINGARGGWYASQNDVTITNHVRLGIGLGHEQGMADEYQTDYGYRWFIGLSSGESQSADGSGGGQEWYVLDEISNVARFAAGQNLTATTGAVLVTNVIVNNGGCFSTSSIQNVTFTGGGATTPATGYTNMISSTCTGGYQIGSITMTNNGAGYTSQPTATADATYQLSSPHLVAEISNPGSADNQTLVNSTGIGGVVINSTNNSGTGGFVVGTGGPNAQSNAAVFSVTNAGAVYQQGSLNFTDVAGNNYWQMSSDGSNNFTIRNANYPANPAFLHAVQNNSVFINSAGSYNVEINAFNNAGTGGFGVYSGGASPVQWFNVGSGGYTKVTALAGTGHRCVYADSSGGFNVEGSDCGTDRSGATVTSVGLSLPSDFAISGSPVTGSGVLTAIWNSQQPHAFLSGPASGSAASPTWRAIVAADVPTLNQATTASAGNVTAASNSTLVTLSALSLPYSQLTGTPTIGTAVVNSVNSPLTLVSGVLGCSGCSGGSMTYPGAGVGVSTGSAWGTSLAVPASALVGISDTQTLTNKSIANTEITGLGTASTAATGTSGAVLSFLNGANVHSGLNTFANNAAASYYVVIQPGTSASAQLGGIQLNSAAATPVAEWLIEEDASYDLKIRDVGATTASDVLTAYINGQTVLNSQGTGSVAINNTSTAGTGGFLVYEGGANSGVIALAVSSSASTQVGSASGLGNLSIGNHLNQLAANDYAGSCTMTTTSCQVSYQHSWTTPLCFAQPQGTTPVSGLSWEVSTGSGSAIVTASASNTLTWNIACIGNPN